MSLYANCHMFNLFHVVQMWLAIINKKCLYFDWESLIKQETLYIFVLSRWICGDKDDCYLFLYFGNTSFLVPVWLGIDAELCDLDAVAQSEARCFWSSMRQPLSTPTTPLDYIQNALFFFGLCCRLTPSSLNYAQTCLFPIKLGLECSGGERESWM